MRELRNKYRAYDAEFLYNMLKEDTSMMFLGGDRDADYQSFFDSIRQANIGQFTVVYELIENGNFEEAEAMLMDIVPELDIFVNLKTVLSIYLDSWCKERFELTGEEYEALFNIANQTPYEAGQGVYTARIMIGFEPDEYGVSYRVQKPYSASEREQVKLYPNPATDYFTLEYNIEENMYSNVEMIIYDAIGRKVMVKTFSKSKDETLINVSSLSKGMYSVSFMADGEVFSVEKLTIVK
jgi:hypothetical protein